MYGLQSFNGKNCRLRECLKNISGAEHKPAEDADKIVNIRKHFLAQRYRPTVYVSTTYYETISPLFTRVARTILQQNSDFPSGAVGFLETGFRMSRCILKIFFNLPQVFLPPQIKASSEQRIL